MPAKKVTAPPDKVELYQELLDSVEGVDTKSKFGSAYIATNGNMYTMISKHGVMGIRRPQPERDLFLEMHQTALFRGDPSWPPAKEFVAVPDDLLSNANALKPCLQKSLAYVRTLKPKGKK